MILRQGIQESGTPWQLILADLALILFLLTLSALAGFPEDGSAQEAADIEAGAPAFAPSQALYRPGPDAPSLGQWLARQERDPRATLTVYARHGGADANAVWSEARALAREARAAGVAVRVVIEKGEETGLHASLGYDSAPSP